ncbi:fas-binding factor 1 isoform X4 [Physeter macrocephalus]|uniref:Fas-binding factor 1 isoform X4 n=1 Tax=Physeter macrocephalus TaxID=9755 RepID=A0A455B809_PHYMC|nr:fas-binding factor 1 isoform X4 [Physeter catodon]|eukprot:XP_028340146.1 fas-binding factor 1 isoform X4 [Physeter catodon]
MAPKAKKGLKGSIDDVLGDLLGDETTPPEKPVKLASRARDATGAAQALAPSRARTKSLLEDDAFSTRAGLAGADAEVSDISDADPQALLQAMKDLDEMDADLLGLKKSNLASSKRSAKGSGKEEQPSPLKPAGVLPANEKRDAIPTKKLPPSPTSLGHQYRKFSFEDLEDPLAGLLSDDEEGIAKKLPGTESETASVKSPAPARDRGPSLPLTPGNTPVRKKEELLFDDGDDIMATLGFGDSPKAERRHTGDQEGPLPARSKLEELLGRGTAAKLLARPGTGEHREFKLDKKYQRPQDKENTGGDEDFTFGAYQPTVGSSDGRQSRRQSVSRFFEGGTDPKGEPGSRQSTPAASSPTQPRRGGADWLGLKDEGLDLLPSSPTREAPRRPPPASQHSAPVGLPSPGAKPPTEGTGSPAKGGQPCQPGASEKKAEEDWLSHALSRKKPQGLAREQHDAACKGQPSVGALPSDRSPVTWNPAALPLHAGDPKRGAAPGDCSGTEPAIGFPSSQEPPGLSVPVQPLLPESLAWSLLPGSEYQQQLLAAQAQLQRGTAELQADHLQSQARLAELEAQVRKLELERTQHQLLLESLQQRHQADLELIDSAHRSRVKVLETSYQQREERLRRENEELSAQYLSRCQEAEQARAELTAQHQRRLAATAQEKDQEVERLRELQRASILEMRKDHEEQLQRLKLLKDREIDAVTSATSHTRSLNGIIEQMEKFSSSLHELSSRVEASHLSTAQERELGIRQRDEQLRALQERLSRQQRDMEEERSRLQEVIGKMEARLSEQSRLLEQERWRVSAEQSKAESAQRALEEQRKVVAQQMAMEREELERAKSALLEEQKSVMRKCGEERRRLAAEWAEFCAQQKLSKERAEREVERALQVDTQREGTLVSLAKVLYTHLLIYSSSRSHDLDILEIGFREVERRGPRGCSGAWPQVSHHLLPESGRSRATAMRQGGQRVLGTLSRAQFNSGEETAERLCCLQEQAELKIRASELRAKEDQLAAEREALEQERQELWLEKERVSAAAQRIRLRAEEVESMSQVASQKYEEGERALREARQVQSEQQARLQLVQQQQERLRQRERHVHQEHLSLAQQRLQLDRIRQDLPSGPVGLLSRAQGPAASGLSAIVAPAPPAPQCSQLPAGPGPSHLHAKLVLLKHTAEQDRDFLENEQFFLEALKKASYNMTSHSA